MALGFSQLQLKYGVAAGALLAVLGVSVFVAWSIGQAPQFEAQQKALVPQTMASILTPPPPPALPVIETPAAMPEAAIPEATDIEQNTPPTTPAAEATDATPKETTADATAANPVLDNVVAPAAPAVTQLTSPTDATAAWQTNARPFDAADTRPRLALMVTDLGLAASVTNAALDTLPPDITLSFWANAPNVAASMAQARAKGFEVVLAVPMEPENFPQNDAGPNSLLTTLTDVENLARLNAHLSKAQNYIGIAPAMGGQFVTARDKLAPIMGALKAKGLMVVDSTQAPQSFITALARTQTVPFIKIDRVIDAAQGEEAWQAQLNGLVQLAKTNGHAAGVIVPYPAAFKQLAPFLADLPNKGIVLAPMSALVK